VRAEWRPRLPAVTHVDGTARVHAVRPEVNPLFHELLTAFGRLTGLPVLLDTSFNLRGEPIVETPRDAVATYAHSDMDFLVLGSWLSAKREA
jgi:carbamoyltransferase